jgi:orotidine-5'-phosphate decarboxylase
LNERDRLILALDVPSLAEATRLIERVGDAVSFYKVGLEMFVAEGPRAVAAVRKFGRVFLDLKLHDIPETVARAVASASATGAEYLTVHAGGGRAMLERAAQVAEGHGIKVLAVTVLTSLDASDLAEVGAMGTPAELVLRRARLAHEAGCHGVIASPAEVAAIRAALPRPFLIVAPGVRPAGGEALDQKRVATPAATRAAGADHVVVGRPIRDAADPAAAAHAIVAELG